MPDWAVQAVWWLLAVAAVAGGATVTFTTDVTRMIIGLACVLVAVAGLYLYYAQPFLAAAQVFVYVGGVLVLILFGIMLVHRAEEGRPSLASRHDPLSAVIGLLVPAILGFSFWGATPVVAEGPIQGQGGTESLAGVLLGPLLPHFEAVGIVLLVALVAVLVVVGGDDE